MLTTNSHKSKVPEPGSKKCRRSQIIMTDAKSVGFSSKCGLRGQAGKKNELVLILPGESTESTGKLDVKKQAEFRRFTFRLLEAITEVLLGRIGG